MPKYNDFDLDLNIQKVDVEETTNAITMRTVGPIYSCDYICPASEVVVCN